MIRPNIITDTRQPWHFGLGLREENNQDDPRDYEPIFRPPIHHLTPPPVHHVPPPPRYFPTPPIKVRPPAHLLPPPKPKPPAPKPPPPKITTCATGFAWNGTTCIPSGSHCNPPNVLDAAGNCALPGTGTCPPGYVVDASGNCTGDPRNPYSLYLPTDGSGSAAPTGAAAAVLAPCASGQYDASGNCIPQSIWGWLQASTLIPGVENLWVAGGGLLAGYFLFMRKSGGRK